MCETIRCILESSMCKETKDYVHRCTILIVLCLIHELFVLKSSSSLSENFEKFELVFCLFSA
jgi:hypothetical protein